MKKIKIIADTLILAVVFSDGSVFNTAGGYVYVSKGKEVWRIQL